MKKISISNVTIAAIIIIVCGWVIKREINSIKAEQTKLTDNIGSINRFLTEQHDATYNKINNANAQMDITGSEIEIPRFHVQGDPNAHLYLFNFTDYQCPHCIRFSEDTLPLIVKNYVDTGKIRFALVDFPLPSHEMASKAAQAAHCAGDQNAFWEMYSKLMTVRNGKYDLMTIASSLRINVTQFERCLDTNKYEYDVNQSINTALAIGIRGVPRFIIAKCKSRDIKRFKVISEIRGAFPYGIFQIKLDEALKGS